MNLSPEALYWQGWYQWTGFATIAGYVVITAAIVTAGWLFRILGWWR